MLKFKIILSLGGSPGNFEPKVPNPVYRFVVVRKNEKDNDICEYCSNRHPQSRTQ